MDRADRRLLDDLEKLPHAARVRRMIELGRTARTDQRTADLLERFGDGGWYERFLATWAVYGSRDNTVAMKAVTDQSRSIRRLGTRLVVECGTDEQATTLLRNLTPAEQRRFAALLAKRRRHEPVDALLEERGDTDDQLLPYASPEATARLYGGIPVSAGHADWRRLAARSNLAADWLQELADQATDHDQRLASIAYAVMPVLTSRDPDQALALIVTLARHIPLAQLNLALLIRRRPTEVAALVLAAEDPVGCGLERVAHRLDADQLTQLVKQGELALDGRWFGRLAPDVRKELWSATAAGWRNGDGLVTTSVVGALPKNLRHTEARRHLALPALATKPGVRLPYVAYLPWDDAAGTVEPTLRNPDPDLRGWSLSALIGAARFDPDHLDDVIALVTARRHEQDPVRSSMLTALADLPPSRWTAAHLDGLGQAVQHALDAADLSYGTAAAAQRLVVGVLRWHPDWAAGWLAAVGRNRGQLLLLSLEDRLTDEDVRRIAPALAPVLAAWEPRERTGAIVQAATMFGRRLPAFTELVAMLERLTRSKVGWEAASAVGAIVRLLPERLPALVPKLLAADPSWITDWQVSSWLHRHRQDLLTPFLGHTAYKGRFSTGKTRFVLPFRDGFEGWTAAQQVTFARVLDEVVRDAGRDQPAAHRSLAASVALPAVEPYSAIEQARLDNKNLALREAALRLLGWHDGGAGVPVLVAALSDERARTAIYALRSAILDMPADRALTLLSGIESPRLTVAKEVVRLLGDLPRGAGHAELLRIAGTELHRDLRVALLRAFWGHLEQDATWPLLEAAAIDPDPVVAGGVLRIPANRISPTAMRRLVGLLGTLLAHPDPSLRLGVLQRCTTLPVSDPERVLAGPLLAALDSPLPDQVEAAAGAVFATYPGRDAGQVATAVERVLGNRRATAIVLGRLRDTARFQPRRYAPTVRAVLGVLAGDPFTAQFQVRLAIAGLDAAEVEAVLVRLAGADLLHADAMSSAIAAVRDYRRRPEFLEELERRTAGSSDERLRRVALVAFWTQTKPPYGWNDAKRARLAEYQADPSPLVAGAAQFSFPPD